MLNGTCERLGLEPFAEGPLDERALMACVLAFTEELCRNVIISDCEQEPG